MEGKYSAYLDLAFWDNSGILRTGPFEVHLRYIKNEGGWSISVSMQPIDTKLSEKMKLVTKAQFDKQLSQ